MKCTNEVADNRGQLFMSAHAQPIPSTLNYQPATLAAPRSRLRWFRTDRWTAGHLVAAGLMGALGTSAASLQHALDEARALVSDTRAAIAHE